MRNAMTQVMRTCDTAKSGGDPGAYRREDAFPAQAPGGWCGNALKGV